MKASIKVAKFNFNSKIYTEVPAISLHTCEHWESSFAHGGVGCCCSCSFFLFEISGAAEAVLSPPWSTWKHQKNHELYSKLTPSKHRNRNTLKPPPFCAVVSSNEPLLLTAAAAAESSSVLPGADVVGDGSASAWLEPRFRSVSREVKSGGGDARFFDPRGGLTLGRFGGGADEEDGDGDGRLAAAAAAELRRVSTIAFAGGEGFASSSAFHP